MLGAPEQSHLCANKGRQQQGVGLVCASPSPRTLDLAAGTWPGGFCLAQVGGQEGPRLRPSQSSRRNRSFGEALATSSHQQPPQSTGGCVTPSGSFECLLQDTPATVGGGDINLLPTLCCRKSAQDLTAPRAVGLQPPRWDVGEQRVQPGSCRAAQGITRHTARPGNADLALRAPTGTNFQNRPQKSAPSRASEEPDLPCSALPSLRRMTGMIRSRHSEAIPESHLRTEAPDTHLPQNGLSTQPCSSPIPSTPRQLSRYQQRPTTQERTGEPGTGRGQLGGHQPFFWFRDRGHALAAHHCTYLPLDLSPEAVRWPSSIRSPSVCQVLPARPHQCHLRLSLAAPQPPLSQGTAQAGSGHQSQAVPSHRGRAVPAHSPIRPHRAVGGPQQGREAGECR